MRGRGLNVCVEEDERTRMIPGLPGRAPWAGRPLTEVKGTGWPLGSSVFDASELEAEM